MGEDNKRIRCKYTAQLTINCEFDTSNPDLIPLDEMKEQWMNLNEIIKEILTDELDLKDSGELKITETENEISEVSE